MEKISLLLAEKTRIPRKDSVAGTSRVSGISPDGGSECPPGNGVAWARAQRNERLQITSH